MPRPILRPTRPGDPTIAAYRFVHAADIHLDSPLRSLALRQPELAALIANATRQAFVRVVDLCLAEQVDALLLAGDLYDDQQTSMKTARFLAEQVGRLHEAGIRVFVIRGNHDALSKITKELVFPDTVKVFGGRAEAVAVERAAGHFAVTVHGLSFAESRAPESLVARYRPPTEGAVNIGLMHTSLGGAPGHDPYAPCGVADLQGTGHHYWALGHIHKRSVVEQAGGVIVMPGMPQGRDINEAGAKSVTLVTIGEDRTIRLEERVTSLAEFARVAVDATGIEDWAELVAAVARAIETARDGIASDHLVARLGVTGRTPLAWRMRRDADLLKAEAEHHAGRVGRAWIEALEIAAEPPGIAAAAPAGAPLLELRRLIAEEVVGAEAFEGQLAEIARELQGQLPAEARALLGADEGAVRARLAALAREGADEVLARLGDAAEDRV
jgi:DNA repair exonuclease SbcCD nuclease subunit